MSDPVRAKSVVDTVIARNGKLFPLDKLAEKLVALRLQKKIVHCHGVFDLLHIGHIRHFEQARRLGDILIVTVTPDIYVNKGPHRPVFNENLRAEAIAALDIVDYVAINRWPLAVEAIKLLQPHFYVKGSDYRETENDRTGGIIREEEAIKSVGGRLAFTNGVTFSSSALLNKYLPVLSPEAQEFLQMMAKRYSADDVIGHLESIRNLKVLVVGEAIIDEYQYCTAIGKSSKEPILAVKRLATERFAGGILAVGNHLANFCDNVGILTLLGEDNPQEEFVRGALRRKIEKTFLYRKGSPTIVKRRFVESYFFTKMMEVYEINDGTLDEADEALLCDALRELLPGYDVVIVVDFGHGMLTSGAIDILCEGSNFLAINAQSNAGNMGYHTISRYPRANYASMAENEIRLEARDRHGDLKTMVLDISQRLGCDNVVVTRGKSGCLCYSHDEGFFSIPAFAGDGTVKDRMGAGDAFLALTAMCVARRVPMEVVGMIGNAVGAQAVATVGHRRSIEREPLFRHIEHLLR